MSISIICPKCETKLKAAPENVGKNAPCPKCKHLCRVVATVENILTVDEPSSDELSEEIVTVYTKSKNKSQLPWIKRIKCDECTLAYNSRVFVVETKYGEARFPIRSHLAIAYRFTSNITKTIVRMCLSLCIAFALWMLLANSYIKALDPEYNNYRSNVFWSLATIFLTAFLINDFWRYGFNPVGPMHVFIRIGGESNKFSFKKDKNEAVKFFQEVENLAHEANA